MDVIEMIEKIEIKNDADLNLQINKIATTINAINKEAARIGDFDLIKKENVDIKAALEVTNLELAALKSIKGTRFSSKSKEERMYEIGKFLISCRQNNLQAIKEAGGSLQVNNEDWKANKDWNINAATDLGTPLKGDGVTGSYLVPTGFADEILRIPDDPSALMGKVRTVPMTVRSIRYPTKLVGATWTWVTNEVTAKTETNPTLGYKTLECETAAAWIAFTEELNEDSTLQLAEYFVSLFRESWQTEFDKQCLNSNASPFTGVLHNASVNILNLGAGSTSFADATFDDCYDLIAELDTKAKRNGASFIMHTTVLDIFKKIKNDVGDYVYQKPEGLAPATLCGYGIILSDAMPDASDDAVSTGFVAFGNPKHILHGDRVGMEFRIFDQTSDTMVFDRIFLRARIRQAFVVGIPAAFAVMKTAAA